MIPLMATSLKRLPSLWHASTKVAFIGLRLSCRPTGEKFDHDVVAALQVLVRTGMILFRTCFKKQNCTRVQNSAVQETPKK